MKQILKLLAAATVAAASFANAQEYPSKQVTLIVGFAPGGGVDTTARTLAPKLTSTLGRPVVVDNRPGNSQNIAARLVAKSPPDGHTLLMAGVTTAALNATLMAGSVGYDLNKDFAPVTLVGYLPLVLVVNASLPANSVAELIKLAKAQPGQFTFGSSGTGSIEHMAAELFSRRAGIKILHVPYKGASAAMPDLMSGQIAAMITTTSTTIANLNGRLKPLMVATPQRLSTLPNVPTAREAGLKDYEAGSNFGMLAPAGTPQAIVARLYREVEHAAAQPDVKTRFQQLGIEPLITTPEETARRIRNETDRWAKVIREANIKLEE